MAQFFSAKSQALFDDVLWLPQAGATTGPTGRPPNSYAILGRQGSVFIDAVYSWTMDAVDQIAHAGLPPTAFVLTHVDVAAKGDAFETIRERYGCPILMHPADVSRPQSARAGVAFMDPRPDGALRSFGIDVIEMPFHTPGSIMLHYPKNRGVLFAGDSAVGPGPRQPQDPPHLERPIVDEGLEDPFKAEWETILAQRLVSSILPLHGTPYVDRGDLGDIARPLTVGAAMDPRLVAEESGDLVAAGVR
ncbi:MBL fold metallo-hydrolase [Acuticoccus sp. M5D2P5]|uniref:MBL fold metallo-hydrolase n=1 Tax=Acuticoccus kalidii TaxID=2910977 RepID=UPI001F4459E6|nr:MBL fold metallo-hydrolase [Acuticoccus kalidii]MCF3934619.1 MBL fold metallo-hydrolase [Acuticoccus kalidii]